ncbi:MAG: two-component system sensor histidine kinase NtrB [Desulfobacteraceae bacterium]
MSSVLYGLILSLHYHHLITPFSASPPPGADYNGPYILYRIAAHITAFFLVALLSSYLSEQTRKSRDELEAKKDDLTQLEALNERIIQSITSGVITLDEERRIILFNKAAETIFGIKGCEAEGTFLTSTMPFLEPALEGVSARAQDRNPPPFIDMPYDSPLGGARSLRLTVSPLRLPGGAERGLVLVFQDLTEIKRIEAEMRRVEGLAVVGELAAGIAHEIRNPMASISGSIQMIRENLEGDAVTERLMDIVLREVGRLNNLVNDFLGYARPRKSDWREFDLNALIRDCLELFVKSGECTGRIEVAPRLEGSILLTSDPEQIRQVLWNLFLNARDAMPDGGVLTVETCIIEDQLPRGNGASQVELTVRDSGDGFSETALDNLFTPFFTTKEGGSGLGLATVRRIVEGLRGDVRGINHPEGGAAVIIRLPLFSAVLEDVWHTPAS